MHVVVVSHPPDLSAYVVEMLKTWGLAVGEFVTPEAVSGLDPSEAPVVICPVSEGVRGCEEALLAYARRGGTVISFLPDPTLAAAAGLERTGRKEGPLRLRMASAPASGLAGESLPVVGQAETYRTAPGVRGLAYLFHPGRYAGESAGVTETEVGRGRVVAFAFDLALCVLMLRQGDPARTEFVPAGDGCARPSHMASEIGPADAGWVPFADLLSRLLVDLARRRMGAPVPLLSHLPGEAPGVLLYSGDEDFAEVAWNDDELDFVAKAGGRMSLYLIPIRTKSTPEDVRRYASRHDVGPHPDLRALDGRPVAERIAEFERQIRMFEEMFGVRTRTLRNHCTAWAGYLEPVEVMERLGVRMDANYICGTYMRDRDSSPYAAFGAAMPMRFFRPDGRPFQVFQQHTHLSDDGIFSPAAEYSFRVSPQQFEVILDRIFGDMVTRFHTPYGVIIHPSNWAKFSRQQGETLLRQAAERAIPIWSYDQWCAFWEARDTWRFSEVAWDGSELRFGAEGESPHEGLRLMVPAKYAGASLLEVRFNGEKGGWQAATRYGEAVALIPLPAGKTDVSVSLRYERGRR